MSYKIYVIIITLFLFGRVIAQPNILKNGDLKATENKIMGNFTRSDSIGLNLLNWFKIGGNVEVFNSSSKSYLPTNSTTEAGIKIHTEKIKVAQQKLIPQTIIIGLIAGKPIVEPFVREYAIAEFHYKLLPNKQYRFSCQIYLDDIGWQGTTHFGFKLENEMPNLRDLSPRYDFDAINIPISKENNVWQQLDTIITTKGDEQFIRIGVFLPDNKVKLKWKNKQFKKEISKKYNIYEVGQYFLIANISFTAIDEQEWLLLNKSSTLKD